MKEVNLKHSGVLVRWAVSVEEGVLKQEQNESMKRISIRFLIRLIGGHLAGNLTLKKIERVKWK
jgi:hypothetical protein